MAKRKTGPSSGINMQDLARVGAQARLASLRAEQDALLAAFPDLRGGSPARPRQARTTESAAPAQRSSKRRGGGMSPAQRKAVGERMRAYWAARRAEKAGTAGEGSSGAGGSGKAKGRRRARRK